MRKVYTRKDVEKMLITAGYRLVRKRGSHFIYKHMITGNIVVVPKDLKPVIAQRLVKENNLVEV